jgi:hypothetical protein
MTVLTLCPNTVLLNSIPSFIDLLELERNLIANTQGRSVDAFAAILLKCNHDFFSMLLNLIMFRG